jgi:hypothetical protein
MPDCPLFFPGKVAQMGVKCTTTDGKCIVSLLREFWAKKKSEDEGEELRKELSSESEGGSHSLFLTFYYISAEAPVDFP